MAWYNPRKNEKGVESWHKVVDNVKFTENISSIITEFWQNTETSFYANLKELISNLDDIETKNTLLTKWGTVLKHEVESLFDANALAQQEDGLNMKRVVKARQVLGKGIGKMINALNSRKQEVE